MSESRTKVYYGIHEVFFDRAVSTCYGIKMNMLKPKIRDCKERVERLSK